MGQYIAQWNYRSSLAEFSQGAEVHMNDDQAQAVLNDSPGVLVPVVLEEPALPAAVVATGGDADHGGQEPGEEEELAGDEEEDATGGDADEDLGEEGDDAELEPGDTPAEGGQEPGEGDRQVTAASNRQKRRGDDR